MGGKRKRDASSASAHPKLARVPDNYSVSKRPLLRPPVPSKYAGASVDKIVYVSSKTPFMSAVKRVQKLLDVADKREAQSALATTRRRCEEGGEGASSRVQQRVGDLDEAAAELARGASDKARDEVVLKGTGRAIDKTLGVGLFFQQRDGYAVRLRTGSVAAVDDIVEKEDGPGADAAGMREGEGGEGVDEVNGRADEAEVAPTRLRYLSVVEVFVSRA